MKTKISTAISIVALGTAIGLPFVVGAWVNYTRTTAEARYEKFQTPLDSAPATHRELMIDGIKFYEKCAHGWCLTSSSKSSLDDFNGPTKSKLDIGEPSTGGQFPVVDQGMLDSLAKEIHR